MAKVTTLRSSGDPVRSPERQALAAVIERRSAARNRLARINEALDQCGRPWELMKVVERAEAALAEATAIEPQRRVARILGDPEPEGPRLDEAERSLAAARDAHASAVQIREVLAQQQKEAEAEVERAGRFIGDEISRVVASEPGIHKLVDALKHHERELVSIRLTLGSIRSFIPHEHRSWDAIRDHKDVLPDPGWREAIAALSEDADAMLPDV